MPHRKRYGFSLVELLVVIAIVGVLAGILIPTIGTIRFQALEVQGTNNLRQLGLAFLTVAAEDDGKLPGWADLDNDGNGTWVDIVNDHLADGGDNFISYSKAFKDPSAVARDLISEDANFHFAPLGGITRGGNSELGRYRYPTAYTNPSRQILLADAGVDTSLKPHGDLYLVDGKFQSWEGFRSKGKVTTDGSDPIDPGDGEAGNIRWFEGTAKFFFLDGHVAKLAQEEVKRYNVNPLYP